MRQSFNQTLIGIAIGEAIVAIAAYFTAHVEWAIPALLVSLVIFADAWRDIQIERSVLARRLAAERELQRGVQRQPRIEI